MTIAVGWIELGDDEECSYSPDRPDWLVMHDWDDATGIGVTVPNHGTGTTMFDQLVGGSLLTWERREDFNPGTYWSTYADWGLPGGILSGPLSYTLSIPHGATSRQQLQYQLADFASGRDDTWILLMSIFFDSGEVTGFLSATFAQQLPVAETIVASMEFEIPFRTDGDCNETVTMIWMPDGSTSAVFYDGMDWDELQADGATMSQGATSEVEVDSVTLSGTRIIQAFRSFGTPIGMAMDRTEVSFADHLEWWHHDWAAT